MTTDIAVNPRGIPKAHFLVLFSMLQQENVGDYVAEGESISQVLEKFQETIK